MSDVAFTGERLHRGNPLFGLDLARHEIAYRFAREYAGFSREHARGGWVLDLGCGSGYGTAELVDWGARAVGLDRIVPDASSRRENGHFVRADLAGIPLASGAFALVLSFQVIEHLEDPTDYLDGIARLLDADGLALITTPNLLMSDGVNPYHVHEYRADELSARLEQRFSSVEMRGVGASERVTRILEERSRRIRRIMRLDPLRLRERMPRSLVEWLFARFAVLVRRRAANPSPEDDITWREFPIGPADERCLDLLAICRNPR